MTSREKMNFVSQDIKESQKVDNQVNQVGYDSSQIQTIKEDVNELNEKIKKIHSDVENLMLGKKSQKEVCIQTS